MNSTSSPRWIETSEGQIIVTDRHRTSRTNRIASEIAGLMALLVFINGFCFSHSPANRLIVLLAKGYDPDWTLGNIYAWIFLGSLLSPLPVMAALTPVVGFFIRQKSTIRLSAGAVELPRRFFPGWWRIDRSGADQIEFFASGQQHVHAYKNEDKHGNVMSGVSAQDVFTVFMRCHRHLVTLGEYIDEGKAAAFITMCRAAAEESAGPARRAIGVTIEQARPSAQLYGPAALPAPTRRALGSGENVSVRRLR